MLNNGKPDTVPGPMTTPPVDVQQNGMDERRRIEGSIKSEVL